jgi:predicted ATP-dependent serine protease
MKKQKYQCQECGKEKEEMNGKNPSCCGKPMKQMKVDVCITAPSAEHARPFNDDEPCDDSRSGKRV